MTIKLPSKNENLKSSLVDFFRIIAWTQWRAENKDVYEEKGLDLYQFFKVEWDVHEVHKMNIIELKKLLNDLEYSLSDVTVTRNEHYSKQKEYKAKAEANNKYSNVNFNSKSESNSENTDQIPF